ncbi:MAG TPA: trehalose-6-phosphate synthase, partial [Gaiellaceae bacterium]
ELSERALIVVSNRGPVSYGRDDDGARVMRRGAGGLATALRGLLARHEVTWIASAIGDEDRRVAAESAGAIDVELAEGATCRLVLLAHELDAYDGFYNVVSNPLLWFVQHALYGLAREPALDQSFVDAWHAYESVNSAFAHAAVAEWDNDPGAAVFFQDYHLYLAPRLVRNARPDALLAHFVHIPWPQAEGWTVLPEAQRRAVHDGLLANDLVGFHTHRWCRNFAASAAAVLDAEHDAPGRVVHRGRATALTARPISVDCAEFEAHAADADVVERGAKVRAARRERLVVRVDRVDPSKNIVRGFNAFALLLERHGEWRGRVTMLALLDPSREDVQEYVDYREALEREAEAVNARFGGEGYRPVDLRIGDDFPLSVAAYAQYDVLLVNPVFDGLNLVAKEGPLVNRSGGVLVLSENAGAHEELREWAVTVSPFDVLGQAEAMHEALSMDAAERERRAAGLAAQVRTHDLAHWIDGLLADLDVASA